MDVAANVAFDFLCKNVEGFGLTACLQNYSSVFIRSKERVLSQY